MAEKSLLEISLFQDIFPPPDQTALPVTFGLLISNILATSKSTQFTCQEIFQKRICHLLHISLENHAKYWLFSVLRNL